MRTEKKEIQKIEQETFDPAGKFPYFFSCDDIIRAFKIRSANDIETVNKWVLDMGEENEGQCLGVESVGTIQLFLMNSYDPDCGVWSLGSVDEFKNRYMKAIDSFVDKLTEKEGDEA